MIGMAMPRVSQSAVFIDRPQVFKQQREQIDRTGLRARQAASSSDAMNILRNGSGLFDFCMRPSKPWSELLHILALPLLT